MKKLITLLFALVGFYSFGQVTYIGQGTTAQISGLTVPSGRSALAYNSTLGQYGFQNSSAVWYWLITEADIDTFAELQAIVADATLVKSGDNISVFTNDSGYLTTALQTTDIDTFAELGAIVADQTLASTSSAQTLTNKTIDATANTITNIDETDLDASVNASLDLADNSLQKNGFQSVTGTTGWFLNTGGNFIATGDGVSSDAGMGSTRGTIIGNYTTGSIPVQTLYIDAAGITAPQLTTAQITTDGAKSIVIKEYTDANYVAIGGSVATNTVDASGFAGNLTTADDTMQEIANKVDALTTGGGGSGDVVGPASATDNAIARFDTTTGKLIQNSGVTISDTGLITTTGGATISGTTTLPSTVVLGANNFVRSGAHSLTLTTTGTTNVTLPTTGTLATLTGTNTLTNKTIAFGSNTLTDVMSTSTAQSVTAGIKKTFQANATNAGFRLAGVTANPSTLVAGDLWYRSDTEKLTYRGASAARSLVAESLAQTLTNKTISGTTNTISNIGSTEITDGSIQAADLEATNSPTDGYFPSYDGATGGVTWEAISGTDSGSGYTFNTITTDETFEDVEVTNAGSSTGKKIWSQVTANAEITINKDSISLVGNPFIIQNWGADSTVVRPAAGTNFYLADSTAVMGNDAFSIKGRQAVTGIKMNSTDFWWQGNYTTFADAVAAYFSDNAATPSTGPGTEANATTGWSEADETTNAEISVESTVVHDGSYAIKATCSTDITTGYSLLLDFTGLTSSTSYTVTAYVRNTGSVNIFGQLSTTYGWSSTVSSSLVNSATYTLISMTATTTGTTAKLRVYSTTTFDTGEIIYVDRVTITPN